MRRRRVSARMLRRVIGYAALSALILAGLGVVVYQASWSFRASVDALASGSRIAALPARVDRVVVSEAPRLVADYYEGTGDRPLVVLAHGSTRRGRRDSLIRFLAAQLQREGFSVLAPDLGASSSGPTVSNDPVLRFEDSITMTADYALRERLAPGGGVAYIGHSFGAGVVLRAGRSDPRPIGVVSLGAPVIVARQREHGEAWLREFSRQRLLDLRLPATPESISAMGEYLMEMDPLEQAAKTGNPPILFVNGQLEARYGTSYLERNLPEDSRNVRLIEIARAPHAYDVVGGPWRLPLALHDPEITGPLIQTITDWIMTRGQAHGSRHLSEISRSIPNPERWSGRGASPRRVFVEPSYDKKGLPLASDRSNRGSRSKTPLRVVRVSNADELLEALEKARAGDEILLSPGTYSVRTKGIRVRGPGTAEHPVTVRAERLGDARIKLDTVEGFVVAEPFWVFQNLDIEGSCGSHSRCDHGFHVVGRGESIVIRNNRIHEFNAAIKVNGVTRGNESYYPDGGLIEANSLYNLSERQTTNPVALIDIVAADNWRVDGNLIADFAKKIGNRTSSGAFIKGNSHGGVLERNLVICGLRLPIGDGARIGLSLGNGGTGQDYCRGRDCSVESTRGVIRNNIVMHCSDVGIYLNRASETLVAHNLLFNTSGIDVRYPQTTAVIVNNVYSGRITERDGGSAEQRHNRTSDHLLQYGDPANGDFSLADPGWLVERHAAVSEVDDDFCGRQRPAQITTVGPFAYSGSAPGCPVFRSDLERPRGDEKAGQPSTHR